MPKKGKKKKDDEDDWEAEADAIALENLEIVKGAALEALFADLIAEGRATEAELDRATDELAAGVKTEEELVAQWKAKMSFDNTYGFSGDGDGEQGNEHEDEHMDKGQRRWREEDGVHKVAALPDMTDEEVRAKHTEFFGVGGSTHALDLAADGLSTREQVGLSESQLDEWRRAADERHARRRAS